VIDVGVDFKLPDSFSIHTKLTESFKNVGIKAGGQMSIWKTWSAGPSPDEPPVMEIRLGPTPSDHPVLVLVGNLLALSRVDGSAWGRFAGVAECALLAYAITAGLIEFAFGATTSAAARSSC
jgi:hypothetical protein